MSAYATVEFWGCYIGGEEKSTRAVGAIFGADVKSTEEELRTTWDAFVRPADKGEDGETIPGQKGNWVAVKSSAEVDARVKSGNKQLGRSFNAWLIAQSKKLEAGGDLATQPDDEARVAAMRELFDRSSGKIRRLEINTGKTTVHASDRKKWLKQWKTTKVK